MNFLFWLIKQNWWTYCSWLIKQVNWLLLMLAPQGFLIYIWEPKIYLQICSYYYGNFQQTSDIHHPSTVLLQHVRELHSSCSNICKVHSQCTVFLINAQSAQPKCIKAQYAQSKCIKAQLSTVKHSKAQSVPCVPVPDHMLCYPSHVIGYWRESKPTLPKSAIQNAVWDNCNKILKPKPS
jgi:hypothetical protein